MTCLVIAEVGLSWDDVNKAGSLSLCSVCGIIVYSSFVLKLSQQSQKIKVLSALQLFTVHQVYVPEAGALHTLSSDNGGEISLKPYNFFE